MKKIKKYIFLGSIILSTIFLTYIFMSIKGSDEREINSSTILNKIQNISELNTVEMYFDEFVDFKDAKKIKGWTVPFTTKSFLFKATARVKAGIDLSKLKQENIIIHKNKITIRLPQPTVTSEEILDAKTYDEKDGLFNEITNDDTLQVIDAYKKELNKKAIDSDILDKARNNAKSTLENWLSLMNFDEISIEFE